MSAWSENTGVTWENADDTIKESFALQRLFWFFRMEAGDLALEQYGDPLDQEVFAQAKEAAEWFGPIFAARAEQAEGSDE